jgi:hypothetical protein
MFVSFTINAVAPLSFIYRIVNTSPTNTVGSNNVMLSIKVKKDFFIVLSIIATFLKQTNPNLSTNITLFVDKIANNTKKNKKKRTSSKDVLP